MKRITPVLFLGLLLSISSVALAGKGHDRNDHDRYYGGQGNHIRQYQHHDNRHHDRHGHRHYVNNTRHAPRHLHQGHYCYAWHPREYVAPFVHFGYRGPNLVIDFQPRAGLYIGGGHW